LVSIGKAERKYLDRYAEPEASLADRLGPFGHALVVPAYGEGEDLVSMLRSVPGGPEGEVLVVLVVNGKPSAPAWVHERNRAVVERLRRAFDKTRVETLSREPPAHLLEFGKGSILCIDRYTPPHWFPDDQGVGLARKVGVDLCLRLWSAGRLGSAVIHSTDADVELPLDYFERPELGREAAAFVYPFAHRPADDPALSRAVLLYEISLRYYVLGLAFAGSPYAHHTIGSTIATGARAYATVRGFPKRAAAEDFYLLSKLAKIGPVMSMRGRPIAVSGRPSSRVPFGTGAAVRRISAKGAEPFTVYAPSLFRYLRVWLTTLFDVDLTGSNGAEDFERRVSRACAKDDLDPAPLLSSLRALGAREAIASARRSKTTDPLRRHLMTWFDAFRTLKLLHTLQRGGLAPRSWRDALGEAPFTREMLGDPSSIDERDQDALRALCERLASIEPKEPMGCPPSARR
jgi:hypothetical protein